uniref:Uncharacterized protein n=1 Tax=Caenorhabditis japonica TaxID=281687 RepID=A0A8R1ESB8_CAEJA
MFLCSYLIEITIHYKISVQAEPYEELGKLVTELNTVSVEKPDGSSRSRCLQMMKNLVIQLENIKMQLGHLSRKTMFGNVFKLASSMLGVSASTVTRAKKGNSPSEHRANSSARKEECGSTGFAV